MTLGDCLVHSLGLCGTVAILSVEFGAPIWVAILGILAIAPTLSILLLGMSILLAGLLDADRRRINKNRN